MSDTKRVENPRKAMKEARLAKLKVINGGPETVKVYPANETMRGVLRHANGTRFREKVDQSVEWPNDSFTTRRIAEGSVLLEPSTSEAKEPDPTLNAREQAAANKPKSKSKNGEPKRKPATHEHPPSSAT